MTVVSLVVKPINDDISLKEKIYNSLKEAICNMNIYAENAQLRLDERRLAEQFAISRTPLREALACLEQEGLVRIVPRRGVFIVRKTKEEILEMITVWAALESMAARLITKNAGDRDIESLRKMFTEFEDGQIRAHIDEYSETNIRFHQTILTMSSCKLIKDIADNLFIHMRSIRAGTISDDDRPDRSIIDHMHIIEALEARDADLAERLVREHTLNLADHVKTHIDYLD
ncbi:MAG: GntR family transcriptional regulator [Rhodospirillales bacterium]